MVSVNYYQIDVMADLPVGTDVHDFVGAELNFDVSPNTSVKIEKYHNFESLFRYLFSGEGIGFEIIIAVVN